MQSEIESTDISFFFFLFFSSCLVSWVCPGPFRKKKKKKKKKKRAPYPSCDFLIDLCAASELFFFFFSFSFFYDQTFRVGRQDIYFLRFGSIEKEYLPSNKSSGRPLVHLDLCQQLNLTPRQKIQKKKYKEDPANSLKKTQTHKK